MPELAVLTWASTETFSGLFGPMRLAVTRDAIDVSRVTAPSGLPLLADHEMARPLGRVLRTEIHNGYAYAEAMLPSVSRSEPFLEELRAGLRDGVSPGMYLLAVDFVEEDGEIVENVTRWGVYEISSVTTPRLKEIGLISLEKTGDKASLTHGPNRAARSVPVDLSRIGKRKTRTVVKRSDISAIGRAPVIPVPTQTREQRRVTMSEIESRVDAKLADLSRREIALLDAEANAPTGAPKPLAEVLLSLAAHATNPSTPAPDLPGVEITSSRVNHLQGRVPSATLALTSSDVYGSAIQTVEVGDLQPQGRRARRLLGLCRQAAPAYGSQSFPVMTSAPASGMIVDGVAPLALTDAMFANPSPAAHPHQGQVRACFTMQSLKQGGAQFEEMVHSSLQVALADLIAGQLVAGDGLSPSLTGLLTIAGTGSTSYLPTNRGGAESFRSAQDALDDITYGPEGRLAFLVATSLFREARKTLREPGTGDYVIEDGQVLGEIPALKSGDLGSNQAILADFSYIVLAVWDQASLVVDAITSPGNIKISVTQAFDVVPLRPNAIIVMDQA